MSEEPKTSQSDHDQEAPAKPGMLRKIVIASLIVAAFAGTYYLGLRKRTLRLNTFTQCLAGKQAKMYGAYWCPHCAEQKEILGSSFQYVPYVECGIQGSHEESEACIQVGVKHFPTWQFANGELREGTLSLQTLSEKTGCGLP
jgi:glutaredoxin